MNKTKTIMNTKNCYTVAEFKNVLQLFNVKYGTPTDWMTLMSVYELTPNKLPNEVKEYIDNVKDLELR